MLGIKRVYEAPDPEDGLRILVDRLWPRGLSKEGAKIDEWFREIAPSNELRKWYSHQPDLWPAFCERYREELEENGEQVERLRRAIEGQRATLLFSSRESRLNNAVALRDYLLTL